jgi:mono/diheme cytochrome c family protein
MLVNLIILIVLIALTLGAALLTWRAVRARRLWVKLLGGLGAGVLTLLLGAIAFAGGSGLAAWAFPGAPPAPDLTVAGSAEQVARGEYLANIACAGCHGQPGPDGLPAGPALSGGWDLAASEGFGFIGQLATENLTPAGKLAGYTDGEIFRVLRHGVDQNGRALGLMSSLPYNQLSDDDLQALVAYLRTLPPAQTTGPTGDRISFIGLAMIGAGMLPTGEPVEGLVTAPPRAVNAEYGRYVATFGECRGCHGPDMTGTPASVLGPAIPNPRPFVGRLSLEQFTQMMRTGLRPDGTELQMPWRNAAQMDDHDLAALYA